jgi:hypothetical protein
MDSPPANPTPLIANCVACQGLVRVPANAPSGSEVRCPHCSESFPLAKVLADLIPELEVVDKTETAPVPHVDQVVTPRTGDGDRQRFVVPAQLSKGAKRRSRNSRSRDRAEEARKAALDSIEEIDDSSMSGISLSDSDHSVDYEDTPVVDPVDSLTDSDSRRSSSRSSQRSSRDSSRRSSNRSSRRSSSRSGNASQGPNPAGELFKVILGGLLAIPIAYGLVLGVFQKDPLGFAPQIEKVAPFLVPAKFKSTPGEKDESEKKPDAVNPDSEPDDTVIDIEKDALPISTLDPSNVR